MKKNPYFSVVFFVVTAVLSSCLSNSGDDKTKATAALGITANEDKGIKEILSIYGGKCKYAVGASLDTKGENEKYFELEVSESSIIEKYGSLMEIPASNIAYLFYKKLESEKSKYTSIHSVLVFASGDKKKFIYTIPNLENVEKKLLLIDRLVVLMKDQNFEQIKELLNDSSYFKYNKNELIESVKKLEPQVGLAKMFSPTGFRLIKADDGTEILHISGLMKREKMDHQFSVDVVLDSEKDEILMFQYEL